MTTVEIILPEDRPGRYLELVAFIREMESFALAKPAVERFFVMTGIPFLTGETATYVSGVLVTATRNQARDAFDRHDAMVAPRLEIPVEKLKAVLDLMEKRDEWLRDPGILEALGVQPPPEDVEKLRSRLIESIRSALASHAARPHADF